METGSKILTGVAATVVLALVGHAATGETFIAGLEQKAQTELAAHGLNAATVHLGHAPLSRGAVLEGDLPEGDRLEALDVVMAIPGIASASWAGKQEPAAAVGSSTEVASAQPAGDSDKIAACQARVDKIIQAKKISFRSGSAYVSLESRQILDELVKALKGCEGLALAVEGHTDDNGDREVNRVMSQERADRIKAGLVERGIAKDRITATGFGASRPLDKGTGADADARNRRIEFRIGVADRASQNDAEAQQGN